MQPAEFDLAQAAVSISAVVCTYNRHELISATIASILANVGVAFELIVVDQSPGDETSHALEQFSGDSRMRFIRSSERGLGRARNVGLRVARADLVAFTDDDVTVPHNWLSVLTETFSLNPNVAVVYCNVLPGPHDSSLGFIPAYERKGHLVASGIARKNRIRAIGAGLAVRRRMATEIGGFDPLLGAGAEFCSAEDADMTIRALIAGRSVLETDAVAVIHHGFRSWSEGKALARRDWFGIGAACAKPIRAGHVAAIRVILYEGVYQGFIAPLRPILRGHRPQGMRRGWYFWKGFAAGLRRALDKEHLTYRDASYGG